MGAQEANSGRPETNRPRIAILYPFRGLGGLHALRDAALIMTERGYAVEFFVLQDENYPPPAFANSAISVVPNHSGALRDVPVKLPTRWRGLLGRCVRSALARMAKVWRPLWRKVWLRFALPRRQASQPYALIFGCDPEGIVDAAAFAERISAPLAYWSLELRFLEEWTEPALRALKLRDIKCSQRAALVISQDEWRAEALAQENGLDRKQISTVSVGSIGQARRAPCDYLRRKFGIATERKIILCTGSISWWVKAVEIVQAAAQWPEEFVLVLHSLVSPKGRTDYERTVIEAADPKHVVLSLDPVSAQEYRQVVDSADIGLAWYDARRTPSSKPVRNLELMGYSAGKIGDYLKSGLPVVVNETTGPREMIAQFDCGVCVAEPGRIVAALAAIFQDYDAYVRNAIRCFDERWELRRQFEPVMDRLEKVIHSQSNGR